MKDAFDVVDGWRTYRCRLERRPESTADAWWWFTVTGDSHRYAPFRSAPGDTQASVQARIVAYYTNHLARRAAPPVQRHQAGRPPKAKPAPSASK